MSKYIHEKLFFIFITRQTHKYAIKETQHDKAFTARKFDKNNGKVHFDQEKSS